MNKTAAKEIIQEYVEGWKENNRKKIIAQLTNDCIIIESHGPTYHGVAQVKQWVDSWINAKSTVKRWDIKSFYFLEKDHTAFCQWNFACSASGKDSDLSGISLVQFKGDKISFIHEYRMIN